MLSRKFLNLLSLYLVTNKYNPRRVDIFTIQSVLLENQNFLRFCHWLKYIRIQNMKSLAEHTTTAVTNFKYSTVYLGFITLSQSKIHKEPWHRESHLGFYELNYVLDSTLMLLLVSSCSRVTLGCSCGLRGETFEIGYALFECGGLLGGRDGGLDVVDDPVDHVLLL